MQQHPLPFDLRFFDIYQQALRQHEEFIHHSTAAKESLNLFGHISSSFVTSMANAEIANTKSIERLSTYGHEFLDQYIEPLFPEMEDSFNLLSGKTDQYQYRDICHTKAWDWQNYTTCKNNIAKLSPGIKAKSSKGNQQSNSLDNTLTFAELHGLIKQMWKIHAELLELANRLSDRVTCLEDWLDKRKNDPNQL